MVKKGTSKENRFAVIKIGGGQEVVREGDLLEVMRLEGDVGKNVVLKDVLLTADGDKLEIGAPLVAGAEVELKILEHIKGKKVVIMKFRAKSRYRRKTGHRQLITRVRVEKIRG